eukprot:TRINITY_DN2060_c0_g1_i1.p1 TRINITY_DN2060_c0_g1~~TRINITY_DN2060_c0_g1_i1.p1  ORF type:complete len:580 (+),score=173.02 TRINITY_DN2060_c0_g1_i1:102-1742(+)
MGWRQARRAGPKQIHLRSLASLALAAILVAVFALDTFSSIAFLAQRRGSATEILQTGVAWGPSLAAGKPAAMVGFLAAAASATAAAPLLAAGLAAAALLRRKQRGNAATLRAALADMKAAELKALCKEKGLPVSGSKPDLIARLEASDDVPEEKPAGKKPAAAKAKEEKPAGKKPAAAKAKEEPAAENALEGMTTAELKALCKEKGLPVSGAKAALLARLKGAGEKEADEPEEEEKEAKKPPARKKAKEEAKQEEKEAKEDVQEKAAAPVAKTTSSSSRSSSSAAPGEFKEGGLARVFFEDDAKYYTAKLVKDNGGGNWDIQWVEDDAEDTTTTKNMKPQTKDFKKGDIVVAKCQDGSWYTAEVKQNAGAGWVEVEWLEEGGEETVLLDNTTPQKKKFKVGQTVEARSADDGEFYSAKVTKDLGKCKFEIEWDEDGDGPEEVFIDGMRVPRVELSSLTVGQKLIGRVGNVCEFGAFVDVGCWTDGLVHVSQMDTKPVTVPSKYVETDQEIEVWVKTIDTDKNRLGLTMVESKVGGGKGRGKGKGKR